LERDVTRLIFFLCLGQSGERSFIELFICSGPAFIDGGEFPRESIYKAIKAERIGEEWEIVVWIGIERLIIPLFDEIFLETFKWMGNSI
jgi:hypothetical protein